MMKQLTLTALALFAATLISPSFAQDKMGKMDKMAGEHKMSGKMATSKSKMATSKSKMAASKAKMHAEEKAKMDKMGGKKKM